MVTANATNTSNPITVAQGGTGAATLTIHGVLIGEAAGAIVATTAGTTGQVLIGSTGADPAFGALGVNSGLTVHGVLLGENNSAIVATTAGSTGQVLIGSTGADPAFGALGVNSGLTAHSLLLGQNTSAITALGAATNGQIPIGSTGADPVLAAPLGTASQITVTVGAGSLTFSLPSAITAPGSLTTTTTLTATTTFSALQGQIVAVTAVTDTYTVLATDFLVTMNKAAAVTITMPASPATGQMWIIKDVSFAAATNNITISGNGHNIGGVSSASTYVINNNGGAVSLTYNGTIFVAV